MSEKVVPDFHKQDTLTLSVEITDPLTGEAVDISGMIFILTMKRSLTQTDDEADMLVKVTAPDGSVEGKINIVASKDDTEVPAGRYQIGLRRIIPSGTADVWTMFMHPIKVLPAIGTSLS